MDVKAVSKAHVADQTARVDVDSLDEASQSERHRWFQDADNAYRRSADADAAQFERQDSSVQKALQDFLNQQERQERDKNSKQHAQNDYSS